jgi:hypothetical protein
MIYDGDEKTWNHLRVCVFVYRGLGVVFLKQYSELFLLLIESYLNSKRSVDGSIDPVLHPVLVAMTHSLALSHPLFFLWTIQWYREQLAPSAPTFRYVS